MSFFFLKREGPRALVGPVGLGHFKFKPSPTEELLHQVLELLFLVSGQFYVRPQAQEPSWDHQAQVSIIATHRTSTEENAPQGPQSATCGGVRHTGLYTPRASS
jgi:hypothetical protein